MWLIFDTNYDLRTRLQGVISPIFLLPLFLRDSCRVFLVSALLSELVSVSKSGSFRKRTPHM